MEDPRTPDVTVPRPRPQQRSPRGLTSLDSAAIVLFSAAIAFGTASGYIVVTAIATLLLVGLLAFRADQRRRLERELGLEQHYPQADPEENKPAWAVPLACVIIAVVSLLAYFFAPLDYTLVISTAVALISALVMWLALRPFRQV